MEKQGNSPTSSIDSSSYPSLPSSSLSQQRRDLNTDLRFGLSLSTSSFHETSSNARQQLSDWPPIKPILRSMLIEKANSRQLSTFFVKVYMEGVGIGRKLDLFTVNDYESLIMTLRRMFKTPISYPAVAQVHPCSKAHVLTYEDQEGDWMMVGDVPWEMFLTTVKRLKIARADNC